MSEDPTTELPGASPFEQRVLAELGALGSEVGGVRAEVDWLRSAVAEIRAQQVAMARNIELSISA